MSAAYGTEPAPATLGKRGAYEYRPEVENACVKQMREEVDAKVTSSVAQIQIKLRNGQLRKETKKLADGRYFTFIIPGTIRSTYPFSEGIRLAGYTEYSKKLGIHCISAWGRLATDIEQERYEARVPRPHPSGRGYVYFGTHYPEGNSWGPSGQFGPRYGSNFTGD